MRGGKKNPAELGSAPHPNPLPASGERGSSRIQREYQPVQPTYSQTTVTPGSRIRKPSLDEMGSHSNRPIPARAPDVDPRAKAGAYGEQVKGPHKPTLDEMGPHAERGLPVDQGGSTPRAARPMQLETLEARV